MKLRDFLINILASGKHNRGDRFSTSDYVIRYALMNFMCLTGFSFLLIFTLTNLNHGQYSIAITCALMASICLMQLVLFRTNIPYIIPTTITLVSYGMTCITLIWLGGEHGVNYLYTYVYPSITILALGIRLGVFLSLALMMLVAIEMFTPGFSNIVYTFDVSIRVMVAYFLVFSSTIVLEIARRRKDSLLNKLKKDAEIANKTKSYFLANMSHEIRTPMNAITGMTELILRKKLSDEIKDHVMDIKQASSNLIHIVNDILDFSKIEANKLEIIPVNYSISSLINDTASIVRIQIMERPVRFYTNIDSNIPNNLIGDEMRLRQIITNLLSNAVKYTERGCISMTMIMDKKEDAQIWLKIIVSDTGIGIKPEDREKLFTNFTQLDTTKTRFIGGSGLGLAISKKLTDMMGGDIYVESTYNSGSEFIITIPQGISSDVPFASIDNPTEKKILVFEDRLVYAHSTSWSLENMKISYTMAVSIDDFAEALQQEEWTHIFAGYNHYKNIKPMIENITQTNKPILFLMVEWGMTPLPIPNANFISLPIHTQSIANAINGKADSKNYFSQTDSSIFFTSHQSQVLVVDDINTNLKMMEGLLSHYEMQIDICNNGLQAIEALKTKHYDIVFMDHMMPELDGIETTAIIRNMEDNRFKTIPIIALTANTMSGMKEMFLKNGFSDFLSKPIDISELEEVLMRWIPKEKIELATEPKTSLPEFISIPGIDVNQGIAMTGGTISGYNQVLSTFYKDAQERLNLLQTIPDKDTLSTFITQVHALKGASASIGATKISMQASELEAAGLGNLALIAEMLPNFRKELSELIKEIQIWECANSSETEKSKPDKAYNRETLKLLQKLAKALKSQKVSDIDSIIEKLGKKSQDSKIKEILEKISDNVLMAEYDKASEIIEKLID